jgi:hypothetical protein
MGGNALKNTVTRKYESDEYFKLVDKIIGKLISVSDVMGCRVIEAYREKTVFGDMDILYTTIDDSPLDNDIFLELFNPNELVKNSEVTSLDVEELQIDFIHIPQSQYEYANAYYSFNDFGNLHGKLQRYFGLKHGHKGLYLPLRDGGNMFAEILITLDHNKALEFVGLNPDTFNKGFDNLDQIFDYTVTSPNYSPEWYLLENISYSNRIRDRKRPTYQKFLKYGEKYTGPRAKRVTDKTQFLQKIFEFFPEAYPDYQAALQKLAVQKFAKEKFNGGIVAKSTGFVNKQLGEFMYILRKDWYFSTENIIFLSDDQILDRILDKKSEFLESSDYNQLTKLQQRVDAELAYQIAENYFKEHYENT